MFSKPPGVVGQFPVCDAHGLRLVIDGCRIAENAYFTQRGPAKLCARSYVRLCSCALMCVYIHAHACVRACVRWNVRASVCVCARTYVRVRACVLMCLVLVHMGGLVSVCACTRTRPTAPSCRH